MQYFCRAFLQVIAPYIKTEIEFTVVVLHMVRVSYKCLLDVDQTNKKSILSELVNQSTECDGPEFRAIQEV